MRLIQVVQGAGLATMVLNLVALWKQEARDPARTATAPRPDLPRVLARLRGARRLAAACWSRSASAPSAFSMQDILLEPYGGEILHLTVGATTSLTALLAVGGVAGFALAARWLGRGADRYRVAAFGALAGVLAFSAVIFAAPLGSPLLFVLGAALIGFGGGLFAAGTLTAAMALARDGQSRSGARRLGRRAGDGGRHRHRRRRRASATPSPASPTRGALGPALDRPATGYGAVYHLEIVLLFATLVAIGPLVRRRRDPPADHRRFGLAEFPG